MTNHISEVMEIGISSHSEIDFVDVVLAPDTKLFLDPCLIAVGKDTWSIQAQSCISSYFDCFYSLYKQKASKSLKLELFQYAHEINATKLGYGTGHNGKAKTPEGMLATFYPINSLIENGIDLSYASDLPIFIRDFAEDCLSDMLTNVLFQVLSDFTLKQCRKYNMKTYPIPKEYHYWDNITNTWQTYIGECLLASGQVILLVPKHFIRQRFYFNTSQYFCRVILDKIQEDESWVDSNGKKKKLSKKDLSKKYKGDSSIIDSTIKLTSKKPSYLSNYHQILPLLYSGQGMTDEELDTILYGTKQAV